MKTQLTANLPPTQHAVQLIGKDKLVFNKRKEVFTPAEHQILCRVEAVGLCFSDLKLLKQFSCQTWRCGFAPRFMIRDRFSFMCLSISAFSQFLCFF